MSRSSVSADRHINKFYLFASIHLAFINYMCNVIGNKGCINNSMQDKKIGNRTCRASKPTSHKYKTQYT